MLKKSLSATKTNYGKEVSPQEARQALYDSQIKNMSFSVSRIINSSDKGIILDIGCGNGIILERLNKIDTFHKNKGWEYFGVDFEKYKENLLISAVKLKLRKRVDFVQLDEFQEMEIPTESYPLPIFTIIRNVIHELDINKTSVLIHKLLSIMEKDDTLFVQDLQVFPEAEKGNVCWQPEYFKKMLTACGFDCHFVEERTQKGNLWFTLQANRKGEQFLNIEQVKDVVLKYRKEQFKQWEDISAKLKKDQGSRNKQIALVDLDLQELALRKQIEAVEETNNKDNPSLELKIPSAYRNWLVSNCRYMDLKNLMPKGKAVRVELPELFIPLYTNSLEKKESADKSVHDLQEEEQKTVDIESLIVKNDYLLIEGQAGSGKTTLQKHVAYSIITQEFDKSLNDYLPLMIFLKEIQGHLGEQGRRAVSNITAENILKDYFGPIGLTVDLIKEYCKAGKQYS